MKLAFSTLGCPAWSLDQILRAAESNGFDGIEVRGLQDDLDVTGRSEFTGQSSLTRRKLRDRGLAIACFSTSVVLGSPEPGTGDPAFDEVKRYAQLCAAFDTPFIRVFGGSIGRASRASALDAAAAHLLAMADIVRGTRVKIVVETHDDWMRAADMRSLMSAVPSESVGLLWDVNHPFMFLGEAPATTWAETGRWICHTHWKDSRRNPAAPHGFEPCLMGEGNVPHRAIYRVLRDGAYGGYLSLEWEKRWHPEIAEPEVAFSQFAEYMRRLRLLAETADDERPT